MVYKELCLLSVFPKNQLLANLTASNANTAVKMSQNPKCYFGRFLHSG
jgi:hypothetical protein